MADASSSALAPWANYYVMLGSASAALTGLMFVVITLVNRDDSFVSDAGVATFSSPTVLHFCSALLVSAIILVPWSSLQAAAVLIGLTGIYGVIHTLRVISRARVLSAYSPDLEDWISYTILPLLAYLVITAGALALVVTSPAALLTVGGGAALLVFVGIRNAWDVVTYIVVGKPNTQPEPGPNPTDEVS